MKRTWWRDYPDGRSGLARENDEGFSGGLFPAPPPHGPTVGAIRYHWADTVEAVQSAVDQEAGVPYRPEDWRDH